MADEVRVDPAVLHGVAGGMDLFADELHSTFKALEEGCAGFRDRLSGWALGSAVGDIAAGTWHEDGNKIYGHSKSYAQSLRLSAYDYETGDHANADNF